MIFYKKHIIATRPRKMRLSLAPFKQAQTDINSRLQAFAAPKMCYNLKTENGKLLNGSGLEDLATRTFYGGEMKPMLHKISVLADKKLNKLWEFARYDTVTKQNDDRLIGWCKSDNKLYEVKLNALNATWQAIPNFAADNDSLQMINYTFDSKNLMLISSKGEYLKIYDGATMTQVETAPNICSMTAHYGRIFAVKNEVKPEVWFSAATNPYNWNVSSTEGGFISFNDRLGGAIKVLSYGDYVYVFRERGINRLTAFGEQKDFAVSVVYEGLENICPDSINLAGEYVLFCTDKNLYMFDGMNVKTINLHNDFLSKDSLLNAKFASLNNKYFLAFKYNFGDGKVGVENFNIYINNAIMIYDVEKASYEIMRGMDVLAMTSITCSGNSLLAMTFDKQYPNKLGMLTTQGLYFGSNLLKACSYYDSDFDEGEKKKVLRKITVYADGELTVKITADNLEKSYNLACINGAPQYIDCKIICKRLGVKIESNYSVLKLENINMEIEMYG